MPSMRKCNPESAVYEENYKVMYNSSFTLTIRINNYTLAVRDGS